MLTNSKYLYNNKFFPLNNQVQKFLQLTLSNQATSILCHSLSATVVLRVIVLVGPVVDVRTIAWGLPLFISSDKKGW